MGWLSPIKGAYPGLGQVDKTLPLAAADLKIERGMIVALSAGDGSDNQKDGVWALPSGADDILYIALTDSQDPTAGFAGTAFDPKGDGTAKITALDLNQDAEYETTVFDTTKTYNIGTKLYADANGKLTTDATNVVQVGVVTGVPTDRWINNAIAVPPGQTDQRLAYRTGATRTVLRFKTK